jgi:alcohol dehydrogenase class IV
MQKQKVFFGIGALKKNLDKLISEFCAKKIFLVYGKNSFRLSGAEENFFSGHSIENVSYAVFNPTPNPDIEEIKKGVASFKEFEPDMVIAVGGGSVIDTAKAINALSSQPDDPISYIKGEKKIGGHRGKPLVAIPTTAGTGSEVTKFATIYINKKKYSLESEKIVPDVAVVDPALTYSLTPYLTASNGLDALCQGIEAYWSVNSTKKSSEYAAKAMVLAFTNIVDAVKTPSKEVRVAMAKASHLSGKAINISKTTACHAVSYPLTSYFGVPHGHAVALTMPAFLVFNSMVTEDDCNDERGVDFVRGRMAEIFSIIGAADGKEGKRVFERLLKAILEDTRLRDFGIRKDDIEFILSESFTPSRMNNNPRRVSEAGLRRILEDIW